MIYLDGMAEQLGENAYFKWFDSIMGNETFALGTNEKFAHSFLIAPERRVIRTILG